ncbi:hypothetical protein [Spirosoma pollinicola]|uniref:Uncharacterized protein n=1 Tax=Spirosoma pollinicola TaxID=2057025 RepID=A0A2K8ZAV3_9BACT|nr:hypothetical protein [Spirosoma pollinicola]AUD07002.1 hypothetical protein CWM47_37395 [Spirosoma pollinicola]
MAKEYKDAMSKLGTMLKQEPIKTPIQEVRPVDPEPNPPTAKKENPDAHFNFWGPRSLMKRVKQHSVDTGMSIKDICIAALEQYLSKPK